VAGTGLGAAPRVTSPLGESELATLTELAETFVAGDAARHARLAADALADVADPAQIAQIRLVLRLMESRAANLALAGRPTPFRAMSLGARERYLLGWGRSRLPQRRSAFGAFRKLMTFLAYADPGTDAPNPHLAQMGYRPDDPPVTESRAAITPFRIPAATGSSDAPVVLDADAVIVGSGAGGGVIAATLAEAGRDVIVLEAGPFVDEAAMPRNELDAFDRLYLDHGLLSTWDGSVQMLAGAGVGGGTTINWMTCIDAPAHVREEWSSAHGLEGVTGSPWADDIDTIERELDVAESTHIPPKDAIILRGARALGWEAAPTRRNAAGCGDCGSCPFGCRRGSKQSGLRVHLARAAGAGARIVPHARVVRILFVAGRAVGVEADLTDQDSDTGSRIRRIVVHARTVVIAAGALRSPAILQASGMEHPAIGRYLRLHPVAVVAGRFTESVEMWRGTMQAARSVQFSDPEPGRNGYVIESAPGHPGLMALALPWEGAQAHARMMSGASNLAPLVAVTRDGGEGRATMTRAGRVRIDYRLDSGGVATIRHAVLQMSRLLRAAGATEILAAGTPPLRWVPGGTDVDQDTAFARYEDALGSFDLRPNRAAVFSAHQMGSVRIGADARTHPCDPWGRVRHGGRGDSIVTGLYVGDTSAFPTGIGVNPMITVMALARRTARTILAET
jgi:choline dehydrogenase-like flavoprotein